MLFANLTTLRSLWSDRCERLESRHMDIIFTRREEQTARSSPWNWRIKVSIFLSLKAIEPIFLNFKMAYNIETASTSTSFYLLSSSSSQSFLSFPCYLTSCLYSHLYSFSHFPTFFFQSSLDFHLVLLLSCHILSLPIRIFPPTSTLLLLSFYTYPSSSPLTGTHPYSSHHLPSRQPHHYSRPYNIVRWHFFLS